MFVQIQIDQTVKIKGEPSNKVIGTYGLITNIFRSNFQELITITYISRQTNIFLRSNLVYSLL